MPSEIEKLPLLIKLLGKTTSDAETEVVAAMRAANKIVREAGWTWEELLTSKVKVVADPFADLPDVFHKTAAQAAQTQPQAHANPYGSTSQWSAQSNPFTQTTAFPPRQWPKPKAAKPYTPRPRRPKASAAQTVPLPDIHGLKI